ncbi:MAG: hypothetical protein ACOYL3_07460 [Desulfuromonadaceae bacterium]
MRQIGPSQLFCKPSLTFTSVHRLLIHVLLLSFGLTLSQTCLASENEFELSPRWVRPGPDTIVKIMLSDKIDVSRKLFLRFRSENTITDLPLASEQTRRRVADVKVPGPMRRGSYKTELVNEYGELVASSPKSIHIAATEKPVITTIMPKVIYPENNRYNFEIIGDKFSPYKSADGENAEKLVIRINDIVLDNLHTCKSSAKGRLPEQHDTCDLPCLTEDWRSIRIHGFKLDKKMIVRPLEISISVDKLVSDPKPLTLSKVQRKIPRIIAIVTLLVVSTLVYILFIRNMARSYPEETNYHPLAYLFIDPRTNTYSLSKLQMIIWAAAAIVAYSYLAASQFLVQWKLGIPSVPEGLPMLLGISAATTALSVSAIEFRGNKGAGLVQPTLADFITTGGIFAPERLQFFIWTVLGALTFVVATLCQDPGSVTEMASIPDTFNQLMGASSLGYLAGKFARKPGPVIRSVKPDAPSGGFRISGENLSPRAQVMLNEEHLTPIPGQKGTDEFVSELIVKPGREVTEIDAVTRVEIKNPDGQLAEWSNSSLPAGPDSGTGEEKQI